MIFRFVPFKIRRIKLWIKMIFMQIKSKITLLIIKKCFIKLKTLPIEKETLKLMFN